MEKLKKSAIDIIEPSVKRGSITPLRKKVDAAKTIQAAIKRTEPNKLLARQFETNLEKKYDKIEKKVPLIQAAIRRKLTEKPIENISTGKKNVYPQAPIYKIDKLRDAVRSVMESIPESIKEIKLNTTKSEMIKFLDKYKYPLDEALSGFKATEKKKSGRPKKEKPV
jgi:hydroxymethylpyrimidine pyrophosphatase-like HAD family hydrolase